MLLDVSSDKMKNQNYNLYLTIIANTMGYVDKDKQYRIVPKIEVRAYLRDSLKLTKYKIKTLLDTYKILGLMDEEGSNFIFYPIKKNFVSLSFSTTMYFLDFFSDFIFKVYCWLLNKYDLHCAYFKGKENYYFNKKELLESIGYSNSTPNRHKLDDALILLEKLGYIQYNHQYIGRPGKHGLYLELYQVNKYGNTQIKSAKETIKDFIDQNTLIDVDMALRLLVPGTEKDVEFLLNRSQQIEIKGEEDVALINDPSDKEKAEKVKEGLEKGIPIKAFLPDFIEAYNKYYKR